METKDSLDHLDFLDLLVSQDVKEKKAILVFPGKMDFPVSQDLQGLLGSRAKLDHKEFLVTTAPQESLDFQETLESPDHQVPKETEDSLVVMGNQE